MEHNGESDLQGRRKCLVDTFAEAESQKILTPPGILLRERLDIQGKAILGVAYYTEESDLRGKASRERRFRSKKRSHRFTSGITLGFGVAAAEASSLAWSVERRGCIISYSANR